MVKYGLTAQNVRRKLWQKREFYCRNTQRADLLSGTDYVELIYSVGLIMWS